MKESNLFSAPGPTTQVYCYLTHQVSPKGTAFVPGLVVSEELKVVQKLCARGMVLGSIDAGELHDKAHIYKFEIEKKYLYQRHYKHLKKKHLPAYQTIAMIAVFPKDFVKTVTLNDAGRAHVIEALMRKKSS